MGAPPVADTAAPHRITKPRQTDVGLTGLFFFFGDVVGNIADVAAQDPAKCLQCVGADAFVSFEAGDLRGANMVMLDESILGNSTLFHKRP